MFFGSIGSAVSGEENVNFAFQMYWNKLSGSSLYRSAVIFDFSGVSG